MRSFNGMAVSRPIQSGRQACLRAKAGRNQSLGRGDQFGTTFQSPAGAAQVPRHLLRIAGLGHSEDDRAVDRRDARTKYLRLQHRL
jgi:hypothetical protein